MYRSDLEAAQARAEALEREAVAAKERADAAEAERDQLRARNAELERRVLAQGESKAKILARAIRRAKPGNEESADAPRRLSRLAWIGLAMVGVGAVTLSVTWLAGFGEIGRAIGAGLVIVGIFLD